MYTNNTVKSIIIATIVMIGMTGLAMAGSTTQTYVGDGTYTTTWNGHHGTMNIDTYTSNGQDHLAVDYTAGYTSGSQTGSTNGWTEIDRNVNVYRKGSITTESFDNSGDIVAINANTRRGITKLHQDVYLANGISGYNVDGVVSTHRVLATGRNYNVNVYTQAGDAYTVVDLNGRRGFGVIDGIAGAGSGYDHSATGQTFNVHSYNGEAVIIGSGDYVGVNARITNDGTTYYTHANGMTYIELNDEYRRYRATGYIYAVDMPNTV